MRANHRFPSVLLLLLAACGGTTTGASKSAPVAVPAEPSPESAIAAGRTPAAPQTELDKPLPVDARIRVGKLPSGLTYYVLPHKKPEKRGQFWLAVNAGAVLEDDDQRGLAHFVEHMGFNGTKRFPKQALVNFLEGIGVKFGPDLNAYTNFDETVYMLQVPTDKPELVEKSFQVLRDWAGNVTFDPGEVEKERGVVLEEWRLGRGAQMRIFDKQAPRVFYGSKYADRITIGKPEIITKAPRDTLVRFYKDWYRPDLMAVIAVGDFDPNDIEKRIKSEFGDLAAPATVRPRPAVPVPPHGETLVSIETDPELTFTAVGIINKMPHRPDASARDYRRSLAEQLYHSMVNSRLDEIRRKPNAPFVFAGSRTGGFVRTADAFTQQAMAKENAVEPALEALLQEVVRVERHGFTATELDRAKKQTLRGYQQAVAQRDKTDSRERAQEIVRHFLQAEAMPGIEAELGLAERFLPTISLEELNVLAKSWSGAGGRVVVVSGPEKMTKPTPQSLVSIIQAVQGRTLTAYEDAVSNTPLVAKPPKAGKVTKTREIAEIGVTEWTLSNGAKVVIKPTDFKNDEIRVSAFSPGGHSLVKDADFESAQFAGAVVDEGGLGSYDAVQLRKALSGKIVSVRSRVDELEEGLSGSASPNDLETLFQLMHLEFTAPRKDETVFQSWRSRQIEQVKNRRLSPETVFFEDMQILMSQNHRRRQPVTPERIEKVNLDKAMSIYKERFAEAGDFTFVFVGVIDKDKLKPLVETYLASLPTKHRKEKWRDVGVRPPKGVKTKTVAKGHEPKSTVLLVFHGPEKWSRDTENDMRMLSEVLSIRLREILREDMGGVYGVRAGGGISRRPRQEYTFTVSFGCSPDNVEKLKEAVFTEIKAVQSKGTTEEYLHKVREARLRAHEVNLKENGFWEGELNRAFRYGDDPKLIPDIKPWVDKISSDRVKAAANRYLRSSEYVLGVLQPEAVSAAPAGGSKTASTPQAP
jgi:zinc protease